LRIGIDIDGVVSDSYTAWLGELNRHFGKNVTVLKDYEMHMAFDVPSEEMSRFFVENVDRLFTIPQPMAGAREGICALLERGHEIVYITARRECERRLTLQWMERHGIPYEHALFTGFGSKVELAREWRLEVFIEDYLKNAKAIAALGIPVLLLDADYNRGETPPGVIRCADWKDIVTTIDSLQGDDRQVKLAR